MDRADRKTALVTGASSGIGRDLALILAEKGHDLVVVARSHDALEQLAAECRQRWEARVEVLPADLSVPDVPQGLFDAVRERALTVDFLINNAGFGTLGEFTQVAWDEQQRMMQVNMVALVHLSRLFIPPMVQRGFGRVMNVASTAAFVSGPRLGLYCASKAFVLSHSVSLARELRRTGVTVTALCPGPTRTDFQNRSGMAGTRLFRAGVMESQAVARQGYAGMMKGKGIVVTGAVNKLAAFSARLLPRTMMASIVGRMNRHE